MDINLNSASSINTERLDQYTVKKSETKAKKHDPLFDRVDAYIEQVKAEDKEYYERMDKKKADKERLKKEQDRKIAAKVAEMEKNGVLGTSDLNEESREILMSKTPGIMAKYTENQKFMNDENEREKHISELV